MLRSMAPSAARHRHRTAASGPRWTLVAHLTISLVLHHAVSAQQLAVGPPASAASHPAGTVTTTTTTTTTVTKQVAAPPAATAATAATQAAGGLGPAAAGQRQQNWMPSVTRASQPGPLPGPSPLTVPSSSSSSSSALGSLARISSNQVTEAATTQAAAPVTNPSSSEAAAGSAATATQNAAATKPWRPAYPFPQCVNTTLSYDVSFVGPRKSIQVGPVNYAYHRFGPLRPSIVQETAASLLSRTTKPNASVVFISGWGTAMYMWPVPLLLRLADTREVIIFDNMRTAHSTDSSTTSLSIPLMANSTAALINKLGLQQPDIWGWSLGGMVAYALLAFHPNKIGNVIIAAASPGGPDGLLPPLPVTQDIVAIERNYTALLPYLFPAGVNDEGVCSFYAAYNSFYASKYTQLATPLGENSITEQSQAVVKFFKDPSVINRLQVIKNRVLILHGVQDRLMPIRNALLGVGKLLGAWMLQFPGQGHGIPFSGVQGVITTTQEFFNFANPLSEAELQQWANYGDTAASRGTGVDTTIIVKSAPVGGS